MQEGVKTASVEEGTFAVLERLRLALKQGKRRVLSVVAALWGLKQVLGWF